MVGGLRLEAEAGATELDPSGARHCRRRFRHREFGERIRGFPSRRCGLAELEPVRLTPEIKDDLISRYD